MKIDKLELKLRIRAYEDRLITNNFDYYGCNITNVKVNKKKKVITANVDVINSDAVTKYKNCKYTFDHLLISDHDTFEVKNG
jgi:hypothetical protein